VRAAIEPEHMPTDHRPDRLRVQVVLVPQLQNNPGAKALDSCIGTSAGGIDRCRSAMRGRRQVADSLGNPLSDRDRRARLRRELSVSHRAKRNRRNPNGGSGDVYSTEVERLRTPMRRPLRLVIAACRRHRRAARLPGRARHSGTVAGRGLLAKESYGRFTTLLLPRT